MKTIAVFFLLPMILWVSFSNGSEPLLPYRWVFVHGKNLANPAHVDEILHIARSGAEHGINGVVLAAGFDKLDRQGKRYFLGLKQLKENCDELGVEIIPLVFSCGYGSTLSHDPNLAVGLPVCDQLFVAQDREAYFVSDAPIKLINGGLEETRGERLTGFTLAGDLGAVIQVDSKDFREGNQSLRFGNFSTAKPNDAIIRQTVAVKPWRSYVIRCWVKTEGISPSRQFRIEAIGKNRLVGELIPRWGATNEWTQLVLGFNSWNHKELEIKIGARRPREGKFWIDGLELEEVGLVNVLRRPGAPITVQSEVSGIVYEEGKDFDRIEDPQLNCRFEHQGPTIDLTSESRIQPGERLRVSYYHGFMSVKGKGQRTTCLSEEKVYKIWTEQARLMKKHLNPKVVFLDVDEVRAGGTCKACTDRGLSQGELLGSCVTRQFELLRKAMPGVEIAIWNDMLDPNHNAGEAFQGKDHFYQARGLYTDSWKHVPGELMVVCWFDKTMHESLEHFSGLGHKTLAAAYYDADDLENPKAWLKAMKDVPGASGIMYTTWSEKYKLLPDFGDLISGKTKPEK